MIDRLKVVLFLDIALLLVCMLGRGRCVFVAGILLLALLILEGIYMTGSFETNKKPEEGCGEEAVDRQSRMIALQTQINPHFLYNTLECIRSKAISEKQDEIAKMTQSLATYFRYSISSRENIVTIQEELNNIRNYFYIQSYRFEDRFRYQFEVKENDDLYDCLIPKMTIQPLVENAFFHGLEPKADNGEILIQVKMTEDTIIMMISDNGVGMDRDTLYRVRRQIERSPEENTLRGEGTGVALYNVNQRIKMIFGASYGLQIYSISGQGTDIEIIIPAIRNIKDLEGMEDEEGAMQNRQFDVIP